MYKIILCVALFLGIISGCSDCVKARYQSLRINEDSSWTFVSIPDFLNVDTDFPQPGWEESLDYILQSIKSENPEFVLVPGDLIMGHWDGLEANDSVSIYNYANDYYSNWKARFDKHGLKYYTAIGDHDIGDNPWRSSRKYQAVKHYKRAFRTHLKMPDNGPEEMKGTAFWWKYENVLFISVDVFESGSGKEGNIVPGVTGEQLSWLESVLKAHETVEHIFIMGHTPVLGPVRKWSSSGLMLNGGRKSQFWQLMNTYNVDAYLCGEVHAVTCTYEDDIMQVAHGGLIGYNQTVNYLVVTVTSNKIYMQIKEIDLLPSGNFLWQTKDNRPLENIDIEPNDLREGFKISGQVIIDKTYGRRLLEQWGYFEDRFAYSSEVGVPVFKDEGRKKLSILCD